MEQQHLSTPPSQCGTEEGGEDGKMDSGSEGGYHKMGEQGCKGQRSTALPKQGGEISLYCNNRVNKEQHPSNNCKNATLLVLKLELKIVIKIWAFPNKNGQSGFAKYAITIRMLRKTFLFFMHNCEKI